MSPEPEQVDRLSRREFARQAALLTSLAALMPVAAKATPPMLHAMPYRSRTVSGDEEVDDIAMVLYPRMTALDLVGPQFVLASLTNVRVHLVAASMAPIVTDTGITIMPTGTFATCPADLAVLFVPGGLAGTFSAMDDAGVIGFLSDRGKRARYVTSVCTGSLLLGAAGLLDGHKATSHWLFRDMLSHFGATPVDARVTVDRNRMTGAGVTAGIDFGLTLAAEMRGQQFAELVQLLGEYAPVPPFRSGSPGEADPGAVAAVRTFYAQGLTSGEAAIVRAAARMRGAAAP